MALKKEITWILAVDRAKAKIYVWNSADEHLKEVTSLQHEEARKPERDFRTDRLGHGQGFNSQVHYSMDEHEHFKDHESRKFLQNVADNLDANKKAGRYDKLVIFAANNTFDNLASNLSAEVKDNISGQISKIVTNMPMNELEEYYKKIFLS